MSWTKIIDELEGASITAVNRLLAAHDGEHVYALALYTDDGGMSMSLAANTEQSYDAQLEKYGGRDITEQDKAYFRWTSSEWKYEMFSYEDFEETNRSLDQQDKGDFSHYFEALMEAMTVALVRVKAAFGDRLADVTAFVTVTDSDDAEAIENASALRINAPALADVFQSRFEAPQA